MLDKTHTPPRWSTTDHNAYEYGELSGHYIVIAHLPGGVYGKVSAAAVASRMCSTFRRLEFGVTVGIGGGVPGGKNDIRLGDVVVSKPGGNYNGVIQYDYGKAVEGGRFKPTGILNKPPQTLLTHMSQLEARQMIEGKEAVSKIVWEALEQNHNFKDKFSPPQEHTDFLFRSSYRHVGKEDTCDMCDKEQLVKRPLRDTRTPYVHYGLIASGDQVIKDSKMRDRLAQQHGILCFEMEAAGLMDELPTLVIQGICDYCDSHKQKQWQGYTALTAAAYAKLLLSVMPVCRTDSNLRHWVVSLARNPRFVGRQDEITKLEGLITMRDGPRIVAITGLGGVGKTQVALELAHRIQDQDKECSVFWVPCTSQSMIEQTFSSIAQALRLDGTKAAEAKKQIKTYLSSKRAGKWLLIFNNADDTEMWLATSQTAPALEDFLPQSEQGRILFTTRNRKLAMKLAAFYTVPIPDVDKETALKILQTLAHEDLLKDNFTTAALLEQLAFLPLAIAQASAYIIENGISLSTYLALLQEQEQGAVKLLSEDFRDPGRYKDIQNPVITTWLISFKQIQLQDQLAADYLSFIACIDPRNISQSLLPLQTSQKRRLDALRLLNAYSFINIQDSSISMHRLMHIATQNWLRSNGLLNHWIQMVADRLQDVFPGSHYTNRRLWREYLPHALALVQGNEFNINKNIDLVERIADCLASDGRYQEAEVLYKELMRIKEERHGHGNPSTLGSMANLASTHRYRGRWNEAEKLFKQVIQIWKTALGAEHPNTLSSTANLALTYCNQGRWNEAEELDMRVMETRKIVLGAEHPDTLMSMANLASTYRNQGRWNEAEKLEVKVIETRKTVLGAEHPDTLSSMANLASTYCNQGRRNEAEKLDMQVIEIRKLCWELSILTL
jgi:nucleoside phosphorylase/tetratricopeptide (TPR) repeat protein